jgi:hypothetical protein
MATREDIYAAIKNADAAGDSESVQKLGAYLQTMGAPEKPKESYLDAVKGTGAGMLDAAKQVGAGLVRGAGTIGNAAITIGSLGQMGSYAERKAGMDAGLRELGADTDSVPFKAGKLGGEIAGTAGVGGVLAGGAKAAGAVPEVVNALRTGGFTTGATQRGAMDALAVRTLGGAATGGATVGLASPDDAGTGAAIGAALPGALKVAGAAGNALGGAGQGTAKWLMESALKGTIKAHSKGDVKVAVETLLEHGINPTNAGVAKMQGLVNDLNGKISSAIEKSGAKIDKQKVLNALSRSREKFGAQVDNIDDLAAVERTGENFAKTFPDQIPVQQAQKLKQGTDRVLRDKFGQMGTATVEAQKDLRYGLKEGISEAVPEVAALNAAESRLLRTLKVAERRALMDVNKNPVPLDAALALASGNPVVALGLLANSKAGSKAMLARGINSLSKGSPKLVNALAGPAAYRSLPRAADTGHR